MNKQIGKMTCPWKISWSPFDEKKFLLCSSELTLYNVESRQGTLGKSALSLSKDYQAFVETSLSDLPYGKCICWAPKSLENVLAISTAGGHVIITNIGKVSSSEAVHLVGKELVPRHGRPCTALDWNTVEPNLIAQSLEKHRADSAVLVWDLQYRSLWDPDQKSTTKGLAEVALGESSSSVCWFRSSPKSFISGINNKILRIYDLRDTARPRTVTYSKGITEVKVDPFNDNRVASCSQSEICIWDTRSFDKPVVKIFEGNNINQLMWNPTRPNLLSCIANDFNFVKLFDLQQSDDDESETSCSELSVRPFAKESGKSVNSYDWHPSRENELLAMSAEGEITLIKVFEKSLLSWCPEVDLSVACGRKLVVCNSSKLGDEIAKDISLKMRERALKNYGIQTEVASNADLTDDPNVANAWKWLHNQKRLAGFQKPIGGLGVLFPVERKRASPVVGFASETKIMKWQVPDSHVLSEQRCVYQSRERWEALDHCGWGTDLKSACSPFLETLCNDRQYARAAAIAIFTLRLGRAIDTLRTASQEHTDDSNSAIDYNLVAMAVAGFSDSKETLWSNMCQSLSEKIDNPYIRSIFTFLISDGDVSLILERDDLALADRIALACLYVPDSQLAPYIDSQQSKVIASANLDGLLLTGLSGVGIELLQKYLDQTSDIQTVASLIIQSYPTKSSLRKEPLAHAWG